MKKIKKICTLCWQEIKNFIISTALIGVLIIVFWTQWDNNKFSAFLSGNIALLVMFFKIEWDKRKENKNIRLNSQRLILAYLNDLRDIALTFTNHSYTTSKNENNLIEMKERMNNGEASNEDELIIYYEADRTMENLSVFRKRQTAHQDLRTIVKKILLDSNIEIDEKLYENLNELQRYDYELSELNLEDIAEKFSSYGKDIIKIRGGFTPSYQSYSFLKSDVEKVDEYMNIDKDGLETKLNELIQIAENRTKYKSLKS